LTARLEELSSLKKGWYDKEIEEEEEAKEEEKEKRRDIEAKEGNAFSSEFISSLRNFLLELKRNRIVEPGFFPNEENSASLEWDTAFCTFGIQSLELDGHLVTRKNMIKKLRKMNCVF